MHTPVVLNDFIALSFPPETIGGFCWDTGIVGNGFCDICFLPDAGIVFGSFCPAAIRQLFSVS
jgi:hypothetical protein